MNFRSAFPVAWHAAGPLALVVAATALMSCCAPARASDRAAVISREKARLASDFAAAPTARPGVEGPLAREYYRRLAAYLPRINANLRDWQAEPGAKFHKRDGFHEHDVRQNATVAFGLAVYAAYAPDPSKPVVRKAREDARALVRYLSVTHRANFLATGGGAPWGDHWQSALWAAQAGDAAWHVWNILDDETRVMAARMIEHEADRFNERPPDNGEWGDTKAEENAWNSQIMSLACSMFPRHPRAKLWRERAIVYMMNSFSTRADHSDSTIVDGRRVRDWVTTVCIHDDYTLENHRRVHPDYMGTISLLLRNAQFYRLGGQQCPDAAYHHVEDCFAVLQALTAANGSYFYINGQDWWPHRHDGPLFVGGLMSAVRKNAAGAFMERSALDMFRKMHSRFKDGSAYHAKEYNYPNVEEEMIARYGDLYIAHRLFGEGPHPVSRAEFARANSGYRLFETGGFVIHRTPASFSSFAWVNGATGLIYPSDDTWFTSPDTRSLTGTVKAGDVKDTAPQLLERSVSPLSPSAAGDRKKGFAFVGRFKRLDGKARQDAAMIALPDGVVLYIERWTALDALDVSELATGSVTFLNENARPISPNFRQFRTVNGSIRVTGESGEPPKRSVWDTLWAMIDNRLVVVREVGGPMAFDERHSYANSRLDQTLSPIYRKAIGPVRSGQVFSEGAAAYLPNPPSADDLALDVQRSRYGLVAVRFGKTVAAVSFGSDQAEFRAFGRTWRLSPLQSRVETLK